MQKKVLGILIALVMVLMSLTGAMAEEPEKNQVVNAGGTVFYDANGVKLENVTSLEDSDDAVVEMSKTIEQYTDSNGPVENEFVVTLNVRTKQNLLEISSDTPDAAVLLVMDVSNSMDDCVTCGHESGGLVHDGGWIEDACPDRSGNSYYDSWDRGESCDYCRESESAHSDVEIEPTCNDYQMRLEVTQDAAEDFLEQFADHTGALEGDRRMVAIVSYGTHAYTQLDWVDVRTQTGMDAAVAAVTNGLEIANGEGTNGGGTSIEAGLALGRNLLLAGKENENELKDIDYLYTIMLTDGQPTYGAENPNDDSTTEMEGYTNDQSGSSTEEQDYDHVEDIADEIKEVTALSKLYSICIGKVANDDGTTTDVWDLNLYGNTEVGEWLESFSTAAYEGNDASTATLFDSFNSVLSQIKLATKAWKVEDWMGDHMVYVDEVGVDGVYNHVTTSLTAEDYQDVTKGTPDFLWDLLASEFDPATTQWDEDRQTGILGYTHKYRARLCNLDTAYVAGTEIPANEQATLRYVVSDEDGNYPSEYETGYFAVPTVKAYAADIVFEKVDDKGNPLPGWQFRLHLDTDKEHGGTEPHFIYKDSDFSGSDGKLTITGIPSGHDYTLLEAAKKAVEGSDIDPDHYIDAGDHPVTVSWGQVTIAGLEDKDADGLLEVVNEYSEEGLGNIKLQKSFAEGSVEPYAIEFTIVGGGKTYNRSLYKTDDPDGDGVWEWTLTGLQPNVAYTVTETNAVDENGNLLRPDHDLSYTITSGDQSISKTFVEGNESTYPKITVDVGAGDTVTVHFKNNMTKKTGLLTLEKAFEGVDADLVGNLTMTVKATPVEANGAAIEGAQPVTLTLVKGADGVYTASQVLPIGYYKLEEAINTDVPDYTHEHYMFEQVKADGSVELTNDIVYVDETTGDEKVQLTLTNHYTQDTGYIHVQKQFIAETPDELAKILAAMDDRTIQVDVTQNNELVETLLLAGDEWSATSSALPVGEYKLVENRTNAEVDGYVHEVLWPDGATVTVGHDTVATVQLTNDYYKAEGHLTVSKSFNFGTGSSAVTIPEEMRISVFATMVDENGAEVEPKTQFQFQIDPDADSTKTNSVTLTLPEGRYKLTETVYYNDIPGYLHSGVTFAGDSSSFDRETNIVTVEDDTDVTVSVTNTYDKQEGGLVITKTFTGDELTAEQKNAITFTVTGPDGFEEKTIKYSEFTNGQYALDNVPTGVYTIVESNADVPGYSRTTTSTSSSAPLQSNIMLLQTAQDPSTVTAEVTDDYGVTVSFTNSYTKQTARLRLEKVFAGDVGDLTEAYKDSITFTVTGPNGYESVVVYSQFTDEGCYYINDALEVGLYTVTESYPDSAYTVTKTYKVNGVESTSNSVTLADGDEATFTITNTYDAGDDIVVRIPFSKTVQQTGTKNPGTNTFYFEYGANSSNGNAVDIKVHNDSLNKYGRVEVVKDDWGYDMIAITVNGANTVSGYFEFSGKAYELPVTVFMREVNGVNWELDEEELKAAGWTYDVTVFPYKYEMINGNLSGWVYSWYAAISQTEAGAYPARIYRTDDPNSVKSEMAFVNTYSANEELPPPPQTGDDSSIALWLALMGVSAVGMVLVAKRRKTC